MAKCILMSGPAGSGKSTWAKNYAEKNPDTVIISTDATRMKLFGSYDLAGDNEKLVMQDMMNEIMKASDEDKDCIVDVAVCKNNRRKIWHDRISRFYDDIDLVIMNTPEDISVKQNMRRDRHVAEEVIHQMYTYFEQPDESTSKLFSNIIYINR